MICMFKPFIVFEGLDGSGKSTQINLTYNWLKDIHHLPIQLAREPGSTYAGEKIRDILKTYKINAMSQFFLFSAARSLLLEQIKPLVHNQWILLDRYIYSTWAYQHASGNLSAKLLQVCEDALEVPKPDLVFLFTHRKRKHIDDWLEDLDHNLVLQGYYKQQKENWIIVPDLDIQDTFESIKNEISKRFM